MCAKTIYEYTPEMDEYLISPGSIDEYLRFDEIFGNDKPVDIEIGTGKGRFILSESLKSPEINFFGIERSLKWLRIAVLRAVKKPRDNCRFMCFDADFVVKLLIQPEAINAYHVYFPDPWHKKRHHKRRILNPRFLERAAETLKPNGYIHLKTDHRGYYDMACESFAECGLYEKQNEIFTNERIDKIQEADEDATHFEIKYLRQARTIHSADFMKK